MRKIILNLAVTLDGFIEGPNGEIDWLQGDGSTDFGDILAEILSDKDIVFYGRESYEKWGNYAPNEKASLKMRDAYQLLNSKTKYVFSRTIQADDTKATYINDNIKERVIEIQNQSGKNIWLYGGAKLITTFLNLDLIDVYQLAVHPVILGKGKRLFEEIQNRHNLSLVDIQNDGSGVVVMRYETVR